MRRAVTYAICTLAWALAITEAQVRLSGWGIDFTSLLEGTLVVMFLGGLTGELIERARTQ